MKRLISYTATYSISKYNDPIIEEAIDYVFKAKTEKDAVYNIKKILRKHEKRLTTWQLIKLLLNK